MNPIPEGNIPVLELDDVSLGPLAESGRSRLHGIRWQVRAGELWVVAGSSGCGKSHLLMTAAGLRAPGAGSVKWFGKPATIPPDAGLRRRIGFVHEGSGRLLHWLTVEENIALPRAYHENLAMPVALQQIEPLLELAGVTALARELPAAVPRPLRSRIGLARALALAPELLFLDNPAAGLDPAQGRWWTQIVQDLVRGHPALGNRPRTVVIAVDDLRPWRRFPCRFAFLHEGEWLLAENLEVLITDRHPALRDLLALESPGD